MGEIKGLARRVRRKFNQMFGSGTEGQSEMIAAGWDRYGRHWDKENFAIKDGTEVRHLGDEWTVEADSQEWSTYGLPIEVLKDFPSYLEAKMLCHLPGQPGEGMEIGPGGGRVTELLLPRATTLHLAEPAASMIAHLKRRFSGESKVRYHHTDGKSLPALPEDSLDFVLSFDVFVHLEPRLIYWYLRQAERLLKPGGVGILHHGTMLSDEGWKQFRLDLERNLEQRVAHDAFGVMCQPIMEKFLTELGFEIVALDLEIIPRDAVAVFRKR